MYDLMSSMPEFISTFPTYSEAVKSAPFSEISPFETFLPITRSCGFRDLLLERGRALFRLTAANLLPLAPEVDPRPPLRPLLPAFLSLLLLLPPTLSLPTFSLPTFSLTTIGAFIRRATSTFAMKEPLREMSTPTGFCPLPMETCQLPTGACLPPMESCLLPIESCPLPTISCPLPTIELELLIHPLLSLSSETDKGSTLSATL